MKRTFEKAGNTAKLGILMAVMAAVMLSVLLTPQPQQAEAQALTTWVTNTGETGVNPGSYSNLGQSKIAQGFRTSNGIYNISELTVEFGTAQTQGQPIKLWVVESSSPYNVDGNAEPTQTIVGSFGTHRNVAAAKVKFTRQNSMVLNPNSNYFVLIETKNDDTNSAAQVKYTNSTSNGGSNSWAIDNQSYSWDKTTRTWSKRNPQVKIGLDGTFHNGIRMHRDISAYESCYEHQIRATGPCAVAVAVPAPSDPSDPSTWGEDIFKSGLNLSTDDFPGFTGWWEHQYEIMEFRISIYPKPTGSEYKTVWYATRTETATSQDFWHSQGTVRFDRNNHTRTIRVKIRDDNVEDSGETFELYTYSCKDDSNNGCIASITNSSVTGTILNSEEQVSTPTLSVSNVTIEEGDNAAAVFTIRSTVSTKLPVYVGYETQDGTAVAGTDYTAQSGTALIAKGESSVTVSVPISNNDTWTGNRTFNLVLGEVINGAIDDETGTATIQDDEPPPLTAWFNKVPDSHNTGNFIAHIKFSQETDNGWRQMQYDVFTVTNATITRVERFMGLRNGHWRLFIKPDNGADVTISLSETTDCSATGAVCTKASPRRALSHSLTTRTPGPPLTAEFDDVPTNHEGNPKALSFQVAFSEPVQETAESLKNAFTVTGGAITSAIQDDDDDLQWDITVLPNGNDNVTIHLPQATDCGSTSAVCTQAEDLLSNSITDEVGGPVRISIGDASVTEDEDAVISFPVTLHTPWYGPQISVNYATSDSSANAGSDYTNTSGTLTFASGVTSKTISVPVLDDETSENQETLTITLSSPSKWSVIVDGTATGTIEDKDTSETNEDSQTPIPTPEPESEETLLTATFTNVPAGHDGSSEFTFVLTFSENVKAGYQRIRDDAFSITSGTTIERAQRVTKGSNIGWTITVKPTDSNPVTVTLPETTDCDATGAICTYDKRKLSHTNVATINGPG